MSNLNDALEVTADGVHAVRLAEPAGAEHLGASLYELQPGEEMVFHYHVQREELLIVLEGRLSLRSATGWEELPEGEVVAFPRGERGAHGYRNNGDGPVRVLMISEMDGPNISVYPDTNQIGVFDAGQRARRRFGALFNVADAVADYGGLSRAKIVPPAPGPRPPPARQRVSKSNHSAWRGPARDLGLGVEALDLAGRTRLDQDHAVRACVVGRLQDDETAHARAAERYRLG